MAVKRPDFANSESANILSDDDYKSLEVYKDGFKSQTLINSTHVNSLLREFSLLAAAVESYGLNESEIGISTPQSTWVSEYISGANKRVLDHIKSNYNFTKETNSGVDTLTVTIGSVTKSQEITNARTSTQLSNNRSFIVDLASTKSSSFNGTSDVTMGVQGVLGVSNGGTGVSNLDNLVAGKAKKISTNAAIGSEISPVYVDANGEIKECTTSGISTTNATYATKVGSSISHPAVGSINKPVYVDANGEIKAIDFTVNANVPSGAKFTDTTYSDATTSVSGLMSASDKAKLNGISSNANNYVLPIATESALGGIKSQKTGTTAGRDYKVQVDSDGTAKVNVPWEDHRTWDDITSKPSLYSHHIMISRNEGAMKFRLNLNLLINYSSPIANVKHLVNMVRNYLLYPENNKFTIICSGKYSGNLNDISHITFSANSSDSYQITVYYFTTAAIDGFPGVSSFVLTDETTNMVFSDNFYKIF